MRVLTHEVEPRDDGRRLDRVLFARLELSVHLLRTLKAREAIWVDGERTHVDRAVHAGQRITVMLGQEEEKTRTGDPNALAVPYIDEDLLIADKAAPLPTLPSRWQEGETLREQVMRYLGEEEPYTFRPVNRLDKGTSGLMAVARNPHAQQLLSRMLHTPSFRREYVAVTQGVPPQEEGVIDAPIGRVPGDRVRRQVAGEGGQEAETHYRVLDSEGGRALLRLRLTTGRTHQIRVHMAYLGCPIVGDYLYGREDSRLPGRFALHSAYISLLQPVTGRKIEVNSAPPEIFKTLLSGEKSGV